ncbi:MAG: RNA polymerase sigma factor [Fimbriimonadaceae bacterium]|nr:RNA polymerase sigma factor [Fimbriimonadaceae bacterium]
MQAVTDMGTPRELHDIAAIAREHYDTVYRFCARRVGIDAAADTAQETFLTAQRAISRVRGASTLSTWLLGIANNECRRMVRKRRCEPPTIELTESGSTEHQEETIINRHALQQALAKLSAEHREVVLLHEVEGLSYEEAAFVLNVPVGTVKSRLHHAFANLRKSLTDHREDAR